MNRLSYLHRAAFALRTFSPTILTLALCLPLQAQSQSGAAQDRGLAAGDASSIQAKPPAPRAQADFGKLPLSFAANQGQVDKRVRFTSQGSGYSLFLTDKEAVLALTKATIPVKQKEGLNGASAQSENPHPDPRDVGHPLSQHPTKDAVKTDVVRMQVAGAAPGLRVEGEEQLPGVANYYIGNDKAKWHSNVPTFAKVKYEEVYPGVDLVYYGNQRQLEYDFVVAPGADAKQVRLHFAGAEKLQLNADGDLTVIAKNGEISFHKPVVYQLKGGQLDAGQRVDESGSQRDLVDGRFVLLAGNEVRFKLGDYDRSRAVVIDPVLVYSTYLGGRAVMGNPYGTGDSVSGIAVDGSGSVYVAGSTSSTNFPVTAGAYQIVNLALHKGTNAFIAKLNATGTALDYSTYLGGNGGPGHTGDYAAGIAVDAAGHAFVTGFASSADFPVTEGAFQTANNGAAKANSNAFVLKLVISGGLDYSTYLGGSGSGIHGLPYNGPGGYGDSGSGIAVDAAGHAYVTGTTYSADFPTTAAAFQAVNHAAAKIQPNIFVTRLNERGTALDYSTYLGGSGGSSGFPLGDSGYGIAVDAAGHAYVTGATYSADFPTTAGAFQSVNKSAPFNCNAFVTKLNETGTALDYSTYLGGKPGAKVYGTSGDGGYGIAVDALGRAYVAGTAFSDDFPTTPGAFQRKNNFATRYSNAFVTKLNRTGTGLDYSTYLGGDEGGGFGDYGRGIAVDASGNAYVTGGAYSTNFPTTPGAFQTANNAAVGNLPGKDYPGTNAFVTELNGTGTALDYSTYLGGSYGDGANGIAIDASGNVYVAGAAGSANFPVTPGAFQTVNKTVVDGYTNGFISKFTLP